MRTVLQLNIIVSCRASLMHITLGENNTHHQFTYSKQSQGQANILIKPMTYPLYPVNFIIVREIYLGEGIMKELSHLLGTEPGACKNTQRSP